MEGIRFNGQGFSESPDLPATVPARGGPNVPSRFTLFPQRFKFGRTHIQGETDWNSESRGGDLGSPSPHAGASRPRPFSFFSRDFPALGAMLRGKCTPFTAPPASPIA